MLTLLDAPATWEQRLQVIVLATAGRAVVSHRSAARLHELDEFNKPTNATVELSLPRGVRFTTRTPAVIHQVAMLEPVDVTSVRGLACVTMERALAELGSVVHADKPVRKALTSARRKGLDLTRARSTAERLHRPGQSGTGLLLRLLDSIPFEGQVPATWFEELLALCVDDPALPPMVLQHPIRDATGRVVARPDIAFPSVRLGLEAHSREFHFGPDAAALDEDRDIAASLCGWELTYLGWHATKRPEHVLGIVRELVAVRTRDLSVGAA